MAEPEEVPEVQVAGLKRPSVDLDDLQRKKFKTEELPLSATQHAAIDHLLHAFKKKGGFDAIRKKVWAEFEEGVCSRFSFFSKSCEDLFLCCTSRSTVLALMPFTSRRVKRNLLNCSSN